MAVTARLNPLGNPPQARMSMEFDADAVAVGADLTDITELTLEGNYDELLLEVENGAVAVTLTDFALLLKLHRDGEWFVFLSATDWDAIDIASLLFVTATGPHELPTATKAQAILNLHGAWAVKLQAAGNTASVIVRGIVRRK